jgi:hypothetical protein
LRDLEWLALESESDVRIIIVYIAEAHARDEWDLGSENFEIQDGLPVPTVHTTLDERLQNAQRLQEITWLQVYADPMTNENAHAFGVAFERLYVFKDGRIKFRGGNGPDGFSVQDVRRALLRI